MRTDTRQEEDEALRQERRDQDLAATRIQARHRGKRATREVEGVRRRRAPGGACLLLLRFWDAGLLLVFLFFLLLLEADLARGSAGR